MKNAKDEKVPSGVYQQFSCQSNNQNVPICMLKMHSPKKLILLFKMTYELVGVSSCVGRTKCWPEYKSLRKQCINLVSTPIDQYDQKPPGKIFNLHFSAI